MVTRSLTFIWSQREHNLNQRSCSIMRQEHSCWLPLQCVHRASTPKHKSTLKWDSLCEPVAVWPISPEEGVRTDLAGKSPWGTRSICHTFIIKKCSLFPPKCQGAYVSLGMFLTCLAFISLAPPMKMWLWLNPNAYCLGLSTFNCVTALPWNVLPTLSCPASSFTSLRDFQLLWEVQRGKI